MVASVSLIFRLSVSQVIVGFRKEFINNLFFSTWACAAGFFNNNNSNQNSYFLMVTNWNNGDTGSVLTLSNARYLFASTRFSFLEFTIEFGFKFWQTLGNFPALFFSAN